jgi:hypothetical protein
VSTIAAEAEVSAKELVPYVVRFFVPQSLNLHSACQVLVDDPEKAIETAVGVLGEEVRHLTPAVTHAVTGHGIPGLGTLPTETDHLKARIKELEDSVDERVRAAIEKLTGQVTPPAPVSFEPPPDSPSPASSQVSAGETVKVDPAAVFNGPTSQADIDAAIAETERKAKLLQQGGE